MNRKDFQRLAETRLQDARVLLTSGRHPGAYYLAGYSIECALKACIAKQVARFSFPDKDFASKVYTHKLEDLVKHAGLQQAFATARQANTALDANWAVVKDWSEAARYQHAISESQADDMFKACHSRKTGVLAWLKTHW
jgi:HEPN domain-containing protein